jgi:Domain of unknown function (DUF4190)
MSMPPLPPRPFEPDPEDSDPAREAPTEPVTPVGPVPAAEPVGQPGGQPDAHPAAWPPPGTPQPPGFPQPPAPYPAWQQPPGPWGPPQQAPGPWGPGGGGAVWALPPALRPAPSGRTNGQAITAFVLGLLAIFPLGIAFGIVALVRIGRTRQRGKGLAITGLALSALWMVVGVGGLLAAVVSYHVTRSSSVAPLNPSGGGDRSVSDLPIGTCFDQPSGQVTDLVPVVPCEHLHDRQLFARVALTGAFPGADQARQQTMLACAKAMGAAFPDPVALQGTAYLYTYSPDGSTWGDGDAEGWCTLSAWDDGDQLSADLMQTSTSYTPVQKAYLKATFRAALLRDEVAASTPSQWQSALTLATQLAQADRTEAHALTTESFGDSFVGQSAASVAKDDLAEAAQAQALSRVGSASEWSEDVDDLGTSSSLNVDTLRSNLGLSTEGAPG